jgi:histidinol-phosphate aminotransferase
MGRPPVRADLATLEGYHSPQVEVEVRLNTNEAPGPPPAAFSDAVATAVHDIEWHRYPDRAATRLRSAIGTLHHVPAERIFCANGSNEVLQTVLLTFAGPGRSVLTFEPTYALHSHLARITGASPVAIPRDDDFGLDLHTALAAIERLRPAVTFLCSPNNPTGIVETEQTVRAVLEAVDAVDGLLVVDEAYGQFAPWSASELLDEDIPLVVSRTYSKTWAMAAARLGYLLGPTWLVDELDKVVLPYHLDSMKQAAGLVALDFLSDMEARVSAVVEERGRLESALTGLGAQVWPSGANFILFRPPGGDGDGVWNGLLERSVLVRNTASWEHLDGCLRVTIGLPHENDRFLSALSEVLT